MEARLPGLTADWLNGWLAALGITVLVPEARLSWSEGASPEAVVVTSEPLGDLVTAAWPTAVDLQDLTIARVHNLTPEVELPRNVPLSVYAARARAARSTGDWTLSSSLTDLGRDDGKSLAEHGPFDPPAPRGETLHDRLLRCHSAVDKDELATAVALSFSGCGRRVKANGLGFDHRRMVASADSPAAYVDPVVEVLAFYGLWFFPVRGTGGRAQTRGWTAPASRRGSFTWPVWVPPLDRWALDGLLDRFYAEDRSARALGVEGVYSTVSYQPKATSDVTRAYASERLR